METYKVILNLTAAQIEDLRLALATEEEQTRGPGFDESYHDNMIAILKKVKAVTF